MPDVILVVDDNPLLLATLGEALSTEYTTPLLAPSGADALDQVERRTTPDAVVIDLDMRDGLLVLAQLECAMGDLVPIIAVSSNPRRLLEAGIADAVLMKPFEVGQLRRCVDRACGRPRGAL
jgi:two-component system, OmpR family, response regulator MprA